MCISFFFSSFQNPPQETMDCRTELRLAAAALQLRGLKHAAKWCAEQLTGLDHNGNHPELTRVSSELQPEVSALLQHGTVDCSDRYLLAKTYFDLGEFQRCAHVLSPSDSFYPTAHSVTSPRSNNGPSSGAGLCGLNGEELFLKGYALYLAGEKAKEQAGLEQGDALERNVAQNPNLDTLCADLTVLHSDKKLDAFGLYLFGVVLKEKGLLGPSDGCKPKVEDAHSVLQEACQAFPWNWSAWLDLAEICVSGGDSTSGNSKSGSSASAVPEGFNGQMNSGNAGSGSGDADSVNASDSSSSQGGGGGAAPEDACLQVALQGPAPWTRKVFLAHALVELGGAADCAGALSELEALHVLFPRSTYLQGQAALAHYALRNYEAAEQLFEELRRHDPYRLENLDTYSNILYVKEAKASLSHLAHVCMAADKYRPETCCVVGNYYSLKAHHEKAVLYFQRALKLNCRFLAAWTLMGHEYMEMKNTGAAIEAYRRGVDVNKRDYRAWYGLGQSYELLTMYFYALYYYRKAVKLRPNDSRMWCALANCCQKLERSDEAIRAYERAATAGDQEGIAKLELARLYVTKAMNGQPSSVALTSQRKAAQNYLAHLEAVDLGPDRPVQRHDGVAEALRFLAEFARHEGAVEVAARYCSRLLECGGAEEAWAKQQLRELRAQV